MFYVSSLQVRDFNLGDTFPIVKHASVDNVEYRTDTQSLDVRVTHYKYRAKT